MTPLVAIRQTGSTITLRRIAPDWLCIRRGISGMWCEWAADAQIFTFV